MKITLKDLLDCKGVEAVGVETGTKSARHIQCPKCLFLVEVGILTVAWDPPSKTYRLQIMCQHCLKESC